MSHPEYLLHTAILKHVRSAFIGGHNPNLRIFHVPNEQRNATAAFFGKMMGVEPGVSDFLLGWPGHTGACEVKAPGKPLTAPQNRFLSWCALVGWNHGVARSVRQAHDLLCSWGLKPSHSLIHEPDYSTKEEKRRQSDASQAPIMEKDKTIKPEQGIKGGFNF